MNFYPRGEGFSEQREILSATDCEPLPSLLHLILGTLQLRVCATHTVEAEVQFQVVLTERDQCDVTVCSQDNGCCQVG